MTSAQIPKKAIDITESEQFNETGWEVPDLEDLEVHNRSTFEVDGTKLEQIDYRLNKISFTTPVGENHDCEFKNLSAYFTESGQQIAVFGTCVFFVDQNGNRTYSAAVTSYIFYFDKKKMAYTKRVNFSSGQKEIKSVLSRWLNGSKNENQL